LAGQAIPHPPQLAGSLLTSAGQVPDACVTAAPGCVVPAGAAAEGTGVAAGVSCTVISGETPVVFLERIQPAVMIMTMTTAQRTIR